VGRKISCAIPSWAVKKKNRSAFPADKSGYTGYDEGADDDIHMTVSWRELGKTF